MAKIGTWLLALSVIFIVVINMYMFIFQVVNSRRVHTRTYHLPGVGGMVKVCKHMFLSTLDVTDKKVRCLSEKKVKGQGVAADDQRCTNSNRNPISDEGIAFIKRHIQSFPAYSSHYGREKSTKKYLSSDLNVSIMYDLYKESCAADCIPHVHYNTYRIIFRSMNLSFKKPKVDTCDTCDMLKVALNGASEEEKHDVELRIQTHQTRAKFMYDMKKQCVTQAKEDDETVTLSFDLQKCLPTPHLTNGRAYYSRQLYTYNLTVFVTYRGQNEAQCFLWDETKGRRGSQEIGSCLFRFLKSLIGAENEISIRRIFMFSDRCSGQNHNFVLCMICSYVVEQLAAEGKEITITHNFMISGHSHMEVDSVHSAIERAKKVNTMSIEIPRDWAVLISQIRRKIPIKVIELEFNDLLALKKLESRYKRPKNNVEGQLFKFIETMTFQYRTDNLGKVYYKADPMADDFDCFEIVSDSERQRQLPLLVPITDAPLELSAAKLADLKKLLPFVKNKQYYETFLKNLVPPKRGRRKKVVSDNADDFDNDMSGEESA